VRKLRHLARCASTPVRMCMCGLLAAAISVTSAYAQTPPDAGAKAKFLIAYMREDVDRRMPISRLDNPDPDDGIAGARLGAADNNTSGRFTNQEFGLKEVIVPIGGDAAAEAKALVSQGYTYFVMDAPEDALLKVSDAVKGQALIFNISAADTDLREENCRADILHVAPSRDMLADALAQYLVWKRWNRWYLVYGAFPDDAAYANAIRRAAKRFGAKVVGEKVYKEDAGASRTDTGHELIQQQMPAFTQDAPDHDVLIVADESEVFGPYLPYRTWLPRPVAGTSGLRASSFHPASEQWGASQFHNRFIKLAGRHIRAIDYNAWLAVRTIGEAGLRVHTADFKTVADYIRSDKFTLAAYEGQAISYRRWNNQLRHAIALGTRDVPVSWSPQPGFLHQFNPLDSLGIDQPESKCHFK
jgi:ABC transporter substrate binding protein (PQQ-dependent alcohol dehydrogenase system)